MRLPALLCSDLHLTANPRDEYRWGLFPWLMQQVQKHQLKTVAILGDLTDSKDYHSAELVNRVVTNVARLAQVGVKVLILMGNHDYLRKGHAFFQFLSEVPNVTFITQQLDTSADGAACLWLPHSKDPANEWAGFDFSHYTHVFMHQTIGGSLSSNGQTMRGDLLPVDLMRAAGKVWSGDIHVPQQLGLVEYVGSPYHVHFGDAFRPRCVVMEDERTWTDVRFRTLSRVTLDVTREQDFGNLRAGDQVKLRVHLQRDELHHWQAIRRAMLAELEAREVQVHGVQLIAPKSRERVRVGTAGHTLAPGDLVLRQVEALGLGPDMYEVGMELLDDPDQPNP